MLDYIRNIAVFMVAEGIILHLITNEDYRKMAKICSGMIMVIIVLSPLDGIFGFTQVFKDFLFSTHYEESLGELRDAVAVSDEQVVERLRREYETLLQTQINEAAEEYGYHVTQVIVTFDESMDDYIGEVNVVLGQGTQREDDMIEDVERVRITIGGRGEKAPAATEDPISITIKNRITDMYGIDYEKIRISMA